MELLFYALLGLLGLIQVMDVWCSYDILTKHGKEKNPVVQFFVKHLGIIKGLLAAKILVAAFMAAAYLFRQNPYALPILAAVNVYYLILLRSYIKRSI